MTEICANYNIMLILVLVTAATSYCDAKSSCNKFVKITGKICLKPQHRKTQILTAADSADENSAVKACATACHIYASCRGFHLPTAGTCETFHYDRCSHEVNSASCSASGEVYVKSLPGLPPGERCPASYGFARLGSLYRLTDTTGNWESRADECNADAGVSKFAEAGDRQELMHMISSKTGHIYLAAKGNAYQPATWRWTVCDSYFDPSLFCTGDPNRSIGNMWDGYTDCVDSTARNRSLKGMCECIDPFV